MDDFIEVILALKIIELPRSIMEDFIEVILVLKTYATNSPFLFFFFFFVKLSKIKKSKKKKKFMLKPKYDCYLIPKRQTLLN